MLRDSCETLMDKRLFVDEWGREEHKTSRTLLEVGDLTLKVQ